MIRQMNRQVANEIVDQAKNIRVMLLLANALDCEALHTLYSGQPQIGAIEASDDLDIGMAKCGRLMPHVLVIDPKVGNEAIQHVKEAFQQSHTKHAIVLDDRLHEGRLANILNMPLVSYMTRQSGFNELLTATIHVATLGERIFDSNLQDRIHRTTRGLRLEQEHGRPSVAVLTARELDIVILLARGYSVRDCAEQLQLAESTIDNHKSRLMKKLQVHKAAELTQLAIRDGLFIV